MKKELVMIIVTGAVIGILAVVMVLLGNPGNMGLCIACFERDIAGALGLHHPFKLSWLRPIILGIALGAFLAALLLREFKPRGGSSPMVRFLLGMFMMVGALCFLGCPTRMALRLGGGDLNALVAIFGFTGGIWAGVFLLKRGFNLGTPQAEKTTDGLLFPALAMLLFGAAVYMLFFRDTAGAFLGSKGHLGAGKNPPVTEMVGLFISLAAGLVVGFLGQRSRMCFASGLRGLIMIKNSRLAIGMGVVIISALAGNLVVDIFDLGAGGFKLGFEQPAAHSAHLWNFLGMGLVGLCAVLLGGCPFRQLVLAGSGNTDSGITVMGMLFGSALAHNLSFAASPKGVPVPGMIAVAVGLAVVFAIGLSRRDAFE